MGISAWGEELQITLPQPGPPAPPRLYLGPARETQLTSGQQLQLEANTTSLQLSWDRPEDNGAAVDLYRDNLTDQPSSIPIHRVTLCL